ncbi:DNA polymerase III [Amylolactobacillus amylotrophicus DSM 20534]|uniref:DNA polymerase III subunit gamma/tau n=3 Tax=Amylolactobacillus TaxID=2767876 RepID=A0A1L6XAT5_9LACO|nr:MULTISPECIES: DNA polymerase III subunit gamma/tau [Amylolactobacillus]APT18094.1 DNA polymerase III subunit gamma/tau [Amylolactobacillus amylophilus DSM 20533 = JCM 1125]KRK37441.1 DNA polymerase III [Amylolactobacillus amylotrophicus DSM 20534]KRM42114.1 DNA polymerase III [Amylolactobacillus amylophilus DSM 20533 = JCM 1125]GED80545.1 DNA polymerase III subunit gamma/tau [Amylolactobacillus amylophilus]
MAYQALYRKWRPRTFADVIGQESITSTLRNSIRINKISHAFLFAGPRGTGKTSCAKILAKTVNCLNIKDGEPCNECANCLAADENRMSDLIEIDAASNNGVDEIRDIRDKVKYAPTEGKYKVYIIDEVHMLSMGAFNALLKTLEEPPEHVIFILATTELQKVPATIISRTQKYTFKRIALDAIIARLKQILVAEEISYEDKALQVIAQVADGGMRDALSILDQIISFEKDGVTYADALEITGFANQEKIEELFLLLTQQETGAALALNKELLAAGINPQNILNELVELATQVLISQKTKTKSSAFLTNELSETVESLDNRAILYLIDTANEALNDLRFTTQQNVPLDIFCVKVTSFHPAGDEQQSGRQTDTSEEMQELQKQVQHLSQQLGALQKTGVVPRMKSATTTGASVKSTVASTNLKTKYRASVYHVLKHATKDDLSRVKDVWPDLISKLEVSQRAMMKVSKPVAAGPDACVVAFDYQLWFERATSDSELMKQLNDGLTSLTHANTEIVLVPKNEWPILRADYLKTHKAELTNRQEVDETETAAQADEADNSQSKDVVKNDIIEQARQLFGDDMIDVKD